MRKRAHFLRAATGCIAYAMLATSNAQLAAPNRAGVTMGHLHYQVSDVQAETDFWVAIGGASSSFFASAMLLPPSKIMALGGPPGASPSNRLSSQLAQLPDPRCRCLNPADQILC